MNPDTQSLLAAGVACHVDGDLDGALVCYGAALETDPGNSLALYNIGCVFEEVGLIGDAAEAFQLAAKARENREPVWEFYPSGEVN